MNIPSRLEDAGSQTEVETYSVDFEAQISPSPHTPTGTSNSSTAGSLTRRSDTTSRLRCRAPVAQPAVTVKEPENFSHRRSKVWSKRRSRKKSTIRRSSEWDQLVDIGVAANHADCISNHFIRPNSVPMKLYSLTALYANYLLGTGALFGTAVFIALESNTLAHVGSFTCLVASLGMMGWVLMSRAKNQTRHPNAPLQRPKRVIITDTINSWGVVSLFNVAVFAIQSGEPIWNDTNGELTTVYIAMIFCAVLIVGASIAYTIFSQDAEEAEVESQG